MNQPYPTLTPQPMNFEPPINQPWYSIDPINALKRFFVKCIDFSGRASRGEYWWVYGWNWGLSVLLNISVALFDSFTPIATFLRIAINIITFLPWLSLTTRRFHDVNRSGWWVAGIYIALLLGTGMIAIPFISVLDSLLPLLYSTSSTIQGAVLTEIEALFTAPQIRASLGLILAGLFVLIVALLTLLIFILLPSNPAGIRFDKTSNVASSQYIQQNSTSSSYPTNTYGYQQTTMQNTYTPYVQPSVPQTLGNSNSQNANSPMGTGLSTQNSQTLLPQQGEYAPPSYETQSQNTADAF